MNDIDKLEFAVQIESNKWLDEVLQSELDTLLMIVDSGSSAENVFEAALMRKALKKFKGRLLEPIRAAEAAEKRNQMALLKEQAKGDKKHGGKHE